MTCRENSVMLRPTTHPSSRLAKFRHSHRKSDYAVNNNSAVQMYVCIVVMQGARLAENLSRHLACQRSCCCGTPCRRELTCSVVDIHLLPFLLSERDKTEPRKGRMQSTRQLEVHRHDV
jgi:hypothetical protein